MKHTLCLLSTGLLCLTALPAQTQPPGASFQPAQALGGARGGGGRAVVRALPRTETGKPFSATVTTQTAQTLPDGTHLTQSSTTMEYRDAEGRVRTEAPEPSDPSGQTKVIMIRDPVSGVNYRLNPAQKSFVKTGVAMVPTTVFGGAVGARGGGGGGRGGGGVGLRGGGTALPAQQPTSEIANRVQVLMNTSREASSNDIVEDLGTTNVNGVPARGTRTTTVVPVGAIGNDREFRSVTERWFSPDLNLVVKSVSTDPRFGTSTYELTNISRQAPDPSLFQVPADYREGRDPQ